MPWDLIFATDVHGNLLVYEYVLRAAKELGIKNIVFGGDFAPKKALIDFNKKMMLEPAAGVWHPYSPVFSQIGYWILHTKLAPSAASIEKLSKVMWDQFGKAQVDFSKSLVRAFGEFKKNNPGFEIFIMPGNDDTLKTLHVLNSAEAEGKLKQCHNKVHKIGDFDFVGYSFISPTPFKFKYWEKPEAEIYKDLVWLTKGLDPEKAIVSTHVPPYGTPLDLLYDGKSHVGSKAVLKFVKKFQPKLTLHGHIHEAPEMSGKFSVKIGESLSINPGGSEHGVHAMLVNLETLKHKPLVAKFEIKVGKEQD
jgi:Icc-related predicted phosphoesterase